MPKGDWQHPWEKTTKPAVVEDFKQAYLQREASTRKFSFTLIELADLFNIHVGEPDHRKRSMVSAIALRLGLRRTEYRPRPNARHNQPVLSLEEEEAQLRERLRGIEYQKALRRIRFETHPDIPDAVICYGVRGEYIKNEGVAKFREFVIALLKGEAR